MRNSSKQSGGWNSSGRDFGTNGGCRSRKFYAVALGRKRGIFASWQDCQASVSDFAGPKFKSFPTLSDAHRWMQSDQGLAADSYPVSADCFASQTKRVESGSLGNFVSCKKRLAAGFEKPLASVDSKRVEPIASLEIRSAIDSPRSSLPAPTKKPKLEDVRVEPIARGLESRPPSTESVESRPDRTSSPAAIEGGFAKLRTEPPKSPLDRGGWKCEVLDWNGLPVGIGAAGRTAEDAWRGGLVAALEVGAVKVSFETGTGAAHAYAQAVRYLGGWRERGWKTSKGHALSGVPSLERLHALLTRRHPFAKGIEATDGYGRCARRWVQLGADAAAELFLRRKTPLWPEKADCLRARFLGKGDSDRDDSDPMPPLLDSGFPEWLERRAEAFRASMRVDEEGQRLFYEETCQHDPRWFEGRAYRGSASKAGAYSGSNKYEPFEKHLVHQTWEEYKEADTAVSKANMERGNLREPDARCRHREARLRQIAEVEIPLAEFRRRDPSSEVDWRVEKVEWSSYVGGVWLPTDPDKAGLACSDDGVITETWHWVRDRKSSFAVDDKPRGVDGVFETTLDDRDDRKIVGTLTSAVERNSVAECERRTETTTYLAEYKCPKSGSYERVPEYYNDQVQYILGMRGLPFAHFGTWGEGTTRFERLDFDPDRYDVVLKSMLAGQARFFRAAVLKAYGLSRYPEVDLEQVRLRVRLDEDAAFAEPVGPEEEPPTDDPVSESPNDAVSSPTTLPTGDLADSGLRLDEAFDDPNCFVPGGSRPRDPSRGLKSSNVRELKNLASFGLAN